MVGFNYTCRIFESAPVKCNANLSHFILGGNKYFHIGIGLPFPDSYYSYGSEVL